MCVYKIWKICKEVESFSFKMKILKIRIYLKFFWCWKTIYRRILLLIFSLENIYFLMIILLYIKTLSISFQPFSFILTTEVKWQVIYDRLFLHKPILILNFWTYRKFLSHCKIFFTQHYIILLIIKATYDDLIWWYKCH